MIGTTWNTAQSLPFWTILLMVLIVMGVIVYRMLHGFPSGAKPTSLRRLKRLRVYDGQNPDDCMEFHKKYGQRLSGTVRKRE